MTMGRPHGAIAAAFPGASAMTERRRIRKPVRAHIDPMQNLHERKQRLDVLCPSKTVPVTSGVSHQPSRQGEERIRKKASKLVEAQKAFNL